ncbi:hypothetical protein EMPG_15542 [Blastomyces silverae]|uniref:Uncharacterized protein n=1 Tax=Blastomyces silverae TaxID=2060906 RepID=A0A0H1BC46_9EURO|nr:hypothetical protein EMPG_15542 [Blastomyces silverae]
MIRRMMTQDRLPEQQITPDQNPRTPEPEKPGHKRLKGQLKQPMTTFLPLRQLNLLPQPPTIPTCLQ